MPWISCMKQTTQRTKSPKHLNAVRNSLGHHHRDIKHNDMRESFEGATISNGHPVLAWLVEYVAVLINKYHVAEGESESAYQKLHGNDPSERLAYFGEKVFFFVPTKRRSNLDLRWSAGIFLGTVMSTNEALVGLPNGDVTRARGVARLRPDQRWDINLMNKLRGRT